MALEKTRVAQLAERYGLEGVLRWKPKKVSVGRSCVILAFETNHDFIDGQPARIWIAHSPDAGTLCDRRGSRTAEGRRDGK